MYICIDYIRVDRMEKPKCKENYLKRGRNIEWFNVG